MNHIENLEGMNPSGVEMIHTPLSFRSLRADEVEVRPAEARNGKTTLLLYQDARCGMNILDETLGTLGWQKEYYEAKGLLMCKIGVRNPVNGEWLWKSDTGSESNIEADKGLASDAFKRAAVSWGIGRELYTAPKIVVPLTDKDMFNGKLCQSFKVKEMSVDNGVITSLTIIDKWGHERFKWGEPTPAKSVKQVDDADNQLDEDLMWHDDSERNVVELPQPSATPGSPSQSPSQSSPHSIQLNVLDGWYEAQTDKTSNVKQFYNYYKGRIEAGSWKGQMNVEQLYIKWNEKRAA